MIKTQHVMVSNILTKLSQEEHEEEVKVKSLLAVTVPSRLLLIVDKII